MLPCILVSLLSLIVLSFSKTRYLWVDAVHGNDDNNGTRQFPVQTVQAAVNFDPSNAYITVLPGDYELTRPVSLYGTSNISIVSRDGPSRTRLVANRYTSTAIFSLVKSNSTTIVGFSLVQGNDPFLSGGIFVRGCRGVTFRDSAWVNNWGLLGGGGYLWQSTGITFSECEFVDNHALLENKALEKVLIHSDQFDMVNTLFLSNLPSYQHIDYETGFGGALHIRGSEVVFSRCRFVNNTAIFGGVVSISERSNVTFSHSKLAGNSALLQGSAVFTLDSFSDLSMFDSQVINNLCHNFHCQALFSNVYDQGGALVDLAPSVEVVAYYVSLLFFFAILADAIAQICWFLFTCLSKNRTRGFIEKVGQKMMFPSINEDEESIGLSLSIPPAWVDESMEEGEVDSEVGMIHDREAPISSSEYHPYVSPSVVRRDGKVVDSFNIRPDTSSSSSSSSNSSSASSSYSTLSTDSESEMDSSSVVRDTRPAASAGLGDRHTRVSMDPVYARTLISEEGRSKFKRKENTCLDSEFSCYEGLLELYLLVFGLSSKFRAWRIIHILIFCCYFLSYMSYQLVTVSWTDHLSFDAFDTCRLVVKIVDACDTCGTPFLMFLSLVAFHLSRKKEWLPFNLSNAFLALFLAIAGYVLAALLSFVFYTEVTALQIVNWFVISQVMAVLIFSCSMVTDYMNLILRSFFVEIRNRYHKVTFSSAAAILDFIRVKDRLKQVNEKAWTLVIPILLTSLLMSIALIVDTIIGVRALSIANYSIFERYAAFFVYAALTVLCLVLLSRVTTASQIWELRCERFLLNSNLSGEKIEAVGGHIINERTIQQVNTFSLYVKAKQFQFTLPCTIDLTTGFIARWLAIILGLITSTSVFQHNFAQYLFIVKTS